MGMPESIWKRNSGPFSRKFFRSGPAEETTSLEIRESSPQTGTSHNSYYREECEPLPGLQGRPAGDSSIQWRKGVVVPGLIRTFPV